MILIVIIAKMKFCPECDRMLFFQEQESKLYEECHHCNYRQESTETVISRTVHREDAYDDPSTRQYMRFCKAVPRTTHRKCPNKECPSREDKSIQEAVLVRKENTMQQLYICVVCNTEWGTS